MGLHKNHKILKINDEEALKKENLTIDYNAKEFDDNMLKLDKLKNTIESEMLAIDKEYDRVNDETTKSYELKRQKLNKEEEDLKDKLKNEVTKIRSNLENILSNINNLFSKCENIKKGIKSFEKDEKTMIQTLTYISNINKNQIEMKSLIYNPNENGNSEIKNLKINFNEKKSIIEYDEYYFNVKEKNRDENYYNNEKKRRRNKRSKLL